MKELAVSFFALLTLMTVVATRTPAGEIEPGFAAYLENLQDTEFASAIIYLSDRPNIRALDQELHSMRAPLAVRHATVLAALGLFGSIALGSVCAALAAALWPWSSSRPTLGPRPAAGLLVVGLLAFAGAMALRLPPIPHALAGRDQGTYLLRAEHTARTGDLGLVDPVLAAAGRGRNDRSGPTDILGMFR